MKKKFSKISLINVFNLSLIVGITGVSIWIITLIVSAVMPSEGRCSCASMDTLLKKSFAVTNQAIIVSQYKDNINPSNCLNCNNNKAALAEYFLKYLNEKKIKSHLHTKNPYFITPDGMKFEILKADGVCGATKTQDPDKANCVMRVDVDIDCHTLPVPSESFGNRTDGYYFGYQYKMIVTDKAILPASNTTNDVTVKALIWYNNPPFQCVYNWLGGLPTDKWCINNKSNK